MSEQVSKQQIKQLQAIIDGARRMVFFGGAGASTESGLPDFRGQNGLYKQKTGYDWPPEIMLSQEFLQRHPAEFFDFHKRYMVHQDVQPGVIHRKLAELEKAGKLAGIITQNIDGLHHLAGSTKVVELHGAISRNYCVQCKKAYGLDAILSVQGVPHCDCGGMIRPDVVLFGEQLDKAALFEAARLIRDADVLLVGGTSLTVYPAAGLVDYFEGDKLILINRDSTPLDDMADLVIHASIGMVMAKIRTN